MMPGQRAQAAFTIAHDHPAFAGHFPGQPIVPAAVLLAETLAAIETATGRAPHEWRLSGAKFLQAVGPGARLTLTHEASRDGRRFELRCGEAIVASGTLAAKGPGS
jgi:3-hydroxymyristoyl/3-hydroxydecanoyl-(acyl carrier protein) dehydratase